MKKNFWQFALLLLSLIVISCNQNDDVSVDNPSEFSQNFGNQVSRDFIGQVVDESNQPIQGATVKIGTSTVQTDVNGVFIIYSAVVYEKFAYITAKKSGFIDGSRAMVPTSGKNNVKIMMISNAPVQTVQSGEASEVVLPNGTKVNFDGAFQDENGVAYSGSVQVSMYHLEAFDDNLSSLMPGMLYAEDQNGNERLLETYGMMNVELKGTGGQKLQLANGHVAQIRMPIDNAQLATAPSTIPLWHFDEVNGYWKEEGSAQKVGNLYVGAVSHFSWWNCDAQFPVVNLTVNVTDPNGNPVSNVAVQIVRTASFGSISTAGFTDNNGHVSGLVPSNEVLTLNIFEAFGQCSVYSANIGPFSSNTVLPTIVLNNSTTVFNTQVVGVLKKCDNSNVTNGYVMMSRTGNSSAFCPVSNGAFTFNTVYCNNDTGFTLKGVDYDNLQTTGSINYTFTAPVTNIGNLTACTAVTEFISYQVDNGNTVLILENLNGSIGANGLPGGMSVNGSSQNGAIYIWGSTNTPGIYTTNEFSIEGQHVGVITNGVTNTVSFNLSAFGAVGQYIDMTFNGTYNDGAGVVHTINGVAHVIRDN
ncbi:hypothetical protein [Flavobacterium pedocola]